MNERICNLNENLAVMTDLTPLFKQCIEIYSDNLGSGSSVGPTKPRSQFRIQDTFDKEAVDLFKNLMNIGNFISEVRPNYLLADSFSNKNGLTNEEKNQIDDELNIQFQKTIHKLDFLDNYETKRNKLKEENLNKLQLTFKNLLGGGDGHETEMLFNKTIHLYRKNILTAINNEYKLIFERFEDIQTIRINREKQLNLINFQNIADLEQQAVFLEEEESQETEKLTQDQLQMLESENKQLLEIKNTQLEQTKNIYAAVTDIMNLQKNLSIELSVQSNSINQLLDVQNEIEIDVMGGNKNLRKANERNKQTAKLFSTTIVILSFLLLLLDWIN